MKNRIIIAGLLLAGSFSLGMAQMSFSSMDANHNGTVSEQEFSQAQAKNMEQRASENRMMKNAANASQFSDIDLNHDGKITQEEMNQFRSQKMMENRSKNSGYGNNKGMKGNGNGKGRGNSY